MYNKLYNCIKLPIVRTGPKSWMRKEDYQFNKFYWSVCNWNELQFLSISIWVQFTVSQFFWANLTRPFGLGLLNFYVFLTYNLIIFSLHIYQIVIFFFKIFIFLTYNLIIFSPHMYQSVFFPKLFLKTD